MDLRLIARRGETFAIVRGTVPLCRLRIVPDTMRWRDATRCGSVCVTFSVEIFRRKAIVTLALAEINFRMSVSFQGCVLCTFEFSNIFFFFLYILYTLCYTKETSKTLNILINWPFNTTRASRKIFSASSQFEKIFGWPHLNGPPCIFDRKHISQVEKNVIQTGLLLFIKMYYCVESSCSTVLYKTTKVFENNNAETWYDKTAEWICIKLDALFGFHVTLSGLNCYKNNVSFVSMHDCFSTRPCAR